MNLSDLCTPKGRRATGKLSLDLLKITGKVAMAGTIGLAGALASATKHAPSLESEKDSRMFSYGQSSDGFGTLNGRSD
jgi:hypothetical protein